MKALATGNPLIMEKAAVDADVARLMRLGERAHTDEQHRLRKALEAAQRLEASLRHRTHRLLEAIARRTDTRGDNFRMAIDGRTYDKRADAGARLATAASELLRSTGHGQTRSATVGRLVGFDVEMEVTRVIADEIVIKVPDALVEARWTVCRLGVGGTVASGDGHRTALGPARG